MVGLATVVFWIYDDSFIVLTHFGSK